MNVLILEDEQSAALRLQQLLQQAEPAAIVMAVLETVKEAQAWLDTHRLPDLVLSDIQLADGLSLDVLKQVKEYVPVIFTTAYDAYTLQAFKLNSIDYLLKPLDVDELKAALAKYRRLHEQQPGLDKQIMGLYQALAGKPIYKSRFLIRQADRLITVATDDVAYVQADDKVVFLHNRNGQKYIIDESLDELEQQLDPAVFFRINRTYITPLANIEKINNHFNGRLKIALKGCNDNDIFVSKARAAVFKAWLNR